METLCGQCTVGQACADLGIGESRFFAQRGAWLQEALGLLEPRSPGRPAKSEPLPTPAELELLRQRVRELEARAAVAAVQAEFSNYGAWDSHTELKKRHSQLCAEIDQPVAALLRDLKRRGMWNVFCTEFGRTPRHGDSRRIERKMAGRLKRVEDAETALRYKYNQIMYRLDLADERLKLRE